MVNGVQQQFIPMDVHDMRTKSNVGSRRPLQPRSVNSSNSPVRSKLSKTTKPKLNILKSNSQSRIQLQLSSDNSSWPVVEKVNSSLSSESETDAVIQSIFRRRVDPLEGQDEHDMFTLKRANPVYDSDDEEEEFMSSPAKRQRKAGTMSLHVDEELPESADVDFSLFFRSS